MLETITEENFAAEVLGSQTPFVLEFWAPWCPYCRRAAPVLENISAEYAGKVRFGRADIDEQPGLDNRFDYQYIPTLFLFRDGGTVGKLEVPSKEEDVRAWLDPLL